MIITAGGTYTLDITEADSTVFAVEVDTTQPVIIENSVIQHAGVGIKAHGGGQLTVRNSTITAITPSIPNSEQQAINSWEPAQLVVEHNQLNYGHGVQVATGAFNSVQTDLSISYNNFVNIGKLSQPGVYQGAVHLDKVTAPNGKILWNRVTNSYGSSWGEDIIALANTQGTAGNLLEVAHCLVNGAYPISGNGASYTGGAIDLADIAGGYIACHHCYVVNYTNNGIMQPTNAPAVTIDNCVAVYDGIADDETTTVSSTFGWGITVNNLYTTGTQSVVTNCRVGHRRWTGSVWENAHYQWENQGSQDGGGNTTLTASAANELAMIAEFEVSVIAAGVTIGIEVTVEVQSAPLPTLGPPRGRLRFHVTDSLTGAIVGRLNVSGWEITEEIRASSVGTLTVPLPSAPDEVAALRSLIRPGDRRPHARAVAMEDPSGTILFYGPISSIPQRSGAEITIRLEDWGAWFRRAAVSPTGTNYVTKRDYVVTNREQCLIMSDLLAIAMAPPGEPNFVIDTPPTSGVNRDRTARMFTKIGEVLDEISNTDQGAEWYTYGVRNLYATTIVPHVAVAWPERGSGQMPLRLSYRRDLQGRNSGNIDSFAWSGDDESPTWVWASDGADDAILWGYAPASTIGVTDIRSEATIDLADGTVNKATATARAKGELTRVASFDGLLDVTVVAERVPYTELVVGDRVRLEVDDGWNKTAATNSSRIIRRVLSGGAGKPTVQVLTVDLDNNRFPFSGGLPGVAV